MQDPSNEQCFDTLTASHHAHAKQAVHKLPLEPDRASGQFLKYAIAKAAAALCLLQNSYCACSDDLLSVAEGVSDFCTGFNLLLLLTVVGVVVVSLGSACTDLCVLPYKPGHK